MEAQIKSIEDSRLLLHDPDPVQPLLTNITGMLRDELNNLDKTYVESYQTCIDFIEKDENWQKLEQEQKFELLRKYNLLDRSKPDVNLESSDAILVTLEKITISAFMDRCAALPVRMKEALQAAAMVFEPKAQDYNITYKTIKTEAELDIWLEETRKQIKNMLKNGPVNIN
jgi:hypothetical protein